MILYQIGDNLELICGLYYGFMILYEEMNIVQYYFYYLRMYMKFENFLVKLNFSILLGFLGECLLRG